MENYQEIDVEQAKELMSQGDIAIVDIRDADAFKTSHIDNAIFVNDRNIEEFVNTADKTKPVLCYCYMGFSSRKVCQYFKDQGFEKVYSMTGGYTEWQKVNDAFGESV